FELGLAVRIVFRIFVRLEFGLVFRLLVRVELRLFLGLELRLVVGGPRDPRPGPKKHSGAAEGGGTYDDPITAAASDQGYETASGATLSPGTIIYNPEVKKYFIMEDSCLECGDEWKCHLSSDDTDDPNPPAGCKAGTYKHIDFWMGPDFQQDATTLNDCEDNS